MSQIVFVDVDIMSNSGLAVNQRHFDDVILTSNLIAGKNSIEGRLINISKITQKL